MNRHYSHMAVKYHKKRVACKWLKHFIHKIYDNVCMKIQQFLFYMPFICKHFVSFAAAFLTLAHCFIYNNPYE